MSCGACKFNHMKCRQDCYFAIYFPGDNGIDYTNLFRREGPSKIKKKLQHLTNDESRHQYILEKLQEREPDMREQDKDWKKEAEDSKKEAEDSNRENMALKRTISILREDRLKRRRSSLFLEEPDDFLGIQPSSGSPITPPISGGGCSTPAGSFRLFGAVIPTEPRSSNGADIDGGGGGDGGRD